MQPNTLYEQDEHAWIEQQIALMQAGKLDQLDGANLALFLNDVMIRDRRELRSRIVCLFIYLLKIQHLLELVTPRMIRGITEQQQEIISLLGSVPRLEEHVSGLLEDAYRAAVRQASVETDTSPRRMPTHSPWTLQEAIEYEPPPPGTRMTSVNGEKKSRVPDEAILKVLAGAKIVDIAREYGIPRQTLADRVKRAQLAEIR
jgi:hypothetical protein